MTTRPDSSGTYITVSLPHGLQLALPSNWQVLDEDARTTIRASALANASRAGLIDAAGSMRFAASYIAGTPQRTLALMNVRYYPDMDVSQSELAAMTAADLAEFDRAARQGLESAVNASGNRFISWKPTERVRVNGLVGLLYGYERSNLSGGTFHSRMLRVLDGPRSFTVTAGHAASASALLEPVTDYILASISRPGG